jgi:hypothetical protein
MTTIIKNGTIVTGDLTYEAEAPVGIRLGIAMAEVVG